MGPRVVASLLSGIRSSGATGDVMPSNESPASGNSLSSRVVAVGASENVEGSSDGVAWAESESKEIRSSEAFDKRGRRSSDPPNAESRSWLARLPRTESRCSGRVRGDISGGVDGGDDPAIVAAPEEIVESGERTVGRESMLT